MLSQWFECCGRFGWIIPLLFLAVMLTVMILVCRRMMGSGGCEFMRRRDQPPASDAPLEILKRRYASGEINREQFEQMKQDLR